MTHKIQWLNRPGTTGATWNPVTGCTKISPGCKHCYAERMSKRLKGRFGYPADDPFAVTGHPDKLDAPYRWRKPRTVFVCSMGDLFHSDVAWPDIERIFQVMLNYKNRHHTFMVLTKRAKSMREFVTANYPGLDRCAPHVWLGTTVEGPDYLRRIDELYKTPAAVRFVSIGGLCEARYTLAICPRCIGSSPEPKPAQVPDLRDQCKAAGVPFFFKRTSPSTETPPDLEVREWPSS